MKENKTHRWKSKKVCILKATSNRICGIVLLSLSHLSNLVVFLGCADICVGLGSISKSTSSCIEWKVIDNPPFYTPNTSPPVLHHNTLLSDISGGRKRGQHCRAIHYTAKSKCRKFETNIPRKGISGPQSQFPHSCVCEQIIYSHDGSAFSAGGNTYVDRSWEYINRSQTHECGNWGWGRAISRKGIYKRKCRCSV